jgi:hypothetical protein
MLLLASSGNIRQPKYGHLKDLHNVIKSIEKILVHGQYNDDTSYGKNITVSQHLLVFFFLLPKTTNARNYLSNNICR